MIVSRASPLLRMVSTKSRCSGVQLGVAQQAGHADDGVHRRADLVAHVGQERALGLVGRDRRAPSLLRLGEQPGVVQSQGCQLGEAAQQLDLRVAEVAVGVEVICQADGPDHPIARAQRRRRDRFDEPEWERLLASIRPVVVVEHRNRSAGQPYLAGRALAAPHAQPCTSAKAPRPIFCSIISSPGETKDMKPWGVPRSSPDARP